MKSIKQILVAAAATRQTLLKPWSRVCSSFFDAVAKTYPHLIKANIEGLSFATLDLIEKGHTDDLAINNPQYPDLPFSDLDDPALKALLEVGAISMHASGQSVVEPSPAALFRGLARLALPRKFLIGLVNATRISRGRPTLSDSEFDALDQELFLAIRRGLLRAFGDSWFSVLNSGSSLLYRSMVLPCTRLPRSQEFYEEGINFYRGQGADTEVFIFSTTSGLVVPREFLGDASKNRYRFEYFTKGILGQSHCNRIYQWERARTAKELAKGFEKCATEAEKSKYVHDARETLSRFASAPNLEIREVDHFMSWKEWFTLVGPNKQQLSVRGEERKGKIGHGVAYNATALRKRSDVFRDIGRVLATVGVTTSVTKRPEFLVDYGPAFAVAGAACLVLQSATERVAQVLREPVLKKSRLDRNASRLIKPLGQTLSKSKIVKAVDGLLEDGERLLRLDALGKTAV